MLVLFCHRCVLVNVYFLYYQCLALPFVLFHDVYIQFLVAVDS